MTFGCKEARGEPCNNTKLIMRNALLKIHLKKEKNLDRRLRDRNDTTTTIAKRRCSNTFSAGTSGGSDGDEYRFFFFYSIVPIVVTVSCIVIFFFNLSIYLFSSTADVTRCTVVQ